ncbi:MAG: hypothetical protein V7K40_31645 [Nostoc sp.]|uniref:hypothetical protein n=1 Tax=Nostoc sp. TaxID=1180 RepID=UPI002FFC3BBD
MVRYPKNSDRTPHILQAKAFNHQLLWGDRLNFVRLAHPKITPVDCCSRLS